MPPKEANSLLGKAGAGMIQENEKFAKLLKRTNVRLMKFTKSGLPVSTTFFAHLRSENDDQMFNEVIEQIEIELKYEGYIERQREELLKFNRFESLEMPREMDYRKVKSLSTEGREKLTKVQPISVGQASRISGVTPADISVLMVYLRK